MTDIANLLTALLEGDLTAAMPVLDWLRERDDQRQYRFVEAVGDYLTNREYALAPSQGVPVDFEAARFTALREQVRIIFWPELPDTVERLKQFSGVPAVRPQVAADPDLLRQWVEAQVAERRDWRAMADRAVVAEGPNAVTPRHVRP